MMAATARAIAGVAAKEKIARPPRSLWSDARRRLFRNRLAVFGMAVIFIFVVVALLADPIPIPNPFAGGAPLFSLPGIAPHSYIKQDMLATDEPPSSQHLLGTDDLGRDMLSRIMMGARISIAVGILATLVSLVIGVTWGAIAGFNGGQLDNGMMRIVDIIYGLPFMMVVILLMAFFPRDIKLLFIGLGAVQWLTMSRIVRGQVLSLKQREFMTAARAIGVPTWRIILQHTVPNAIGPVIVYATLLVPAVMLEEAFLSFLGLGVQPPLPSWGSLVSEGAGLSSMRTNPWQLIFPAVCLSLTLLSLNFLGDGLRDALDPQSR
jgi:oligopeptide transport system permease protein